MYVEIHMLPSEYQSLKNKRKDVDNLAKTLLDSMEKIVYENDSQIRTLMISKYPNEKRQPFLIAIKCLKNDDEQLTKIPNPYLIYSKSTIYDKKQSF